MFPAGHTFGGSLQFDALAMAVFAGVALLYWLLRMGTLPRIALRRSTPTEGLCAGQVPTYLTRRPGDLAAMVLQPQEAILKELSRHEPRNQQAISMELSSDESCCSTGSNQARDQAGITQLSWQLSSR